MVKDVLVMKSEARPLDALSAFKGDRIPPIVLVRQNHICGVAPPHSGFWARALREPWSTMAEIAGKDYVLARETDLLTSVFERMNRHSKSMALVVSGPGIPRRENIRGVITKASIAENIILTTE